MSELRIYDSLRRQKVPFEPVVPGKASIYLCGPTTYSSAHIGHAYSAILFDMVRRSLAWLGYEVRFVRNITDVEDKIFARAIENGEEPLALASRYADEYNRDMARFGVLSPDIEPRVSTHISDIIELIERIIAVGAGYAVDGDVYFAVEAFDSYGKLSGQSIEDLRAGARVDVDERKRAPGDFALWKAAKPGEPSWDSPWGKGRPGWHIECSAMCVRHMGETFDIHGGGKDLVFPHHENEIAQSQSVYGTDSFARYWMHNGFLNFGGEKMSKSLGNVFGCAQIADAAGAEALRFYSLSHHYRSPANFEVEEIDGVARFRDLEAADRRLDYFYTTLRRLDEHLAAGKSAGEGEVLPEAEALVPAAREGLLDDFNTPVVLAALSEAARVANKLLDEPKGVPKPVRRRSLERLAQDIRDVASRGLGILASPPAEFLSERRSRLAQARKLNVGQVEQLLTERGEARQAKDWARADAIRDQLRALSVEVLDTAQGVDWRIIE